MFRDKVALRIVIRKHEIAFRADAVKATDAFDVRKNIRNRKPSVSKKDYVIIFLREKISAKRNTLFQKVSLEGIRRIRRMLFKTAKPKRNTLFSNTKREQKNNKFILAVHVVKRYIYFLVRVFNSILRDDVRDERRVARISDRRERSKETTKTTLKRFKVNRERRECFTSDISGYDRFGANHRSNNNNEIIKNRF